MTTLVKTEILGCDFDLDECADIATHGCIAGVPGFIHTGDNIEAYDEYEYTIMDSLEEWADELGATNGMEMIMDSLNRRDITPPLMQSKSVQCGCTLRCRLTTSASKKDTRILSEV